MAESETPDPPKPETVDPLETDNLPQPQPDLPEHLSYKKRLQEYIARFYLPHPVYYIVNEGAFSNVPRFRSTVLVDGIYYSSQNTFSHRKDADQDAARVALFCIKQKLKDEGSTFVREHTIVCKALLNEYAMKMRVDKPTFSTTQSEGYLTAFVSSVAFNGVSFTGETAKNKKEAEQLAARAAILSLLDSESGFIISMMIKDKVRLYSVFNEAKVSDNIQNGSVGVETNQEYNMPISAIPEGQPTNMPPPIPPSLHEFRKPTTEAPPPPSESVTPIVFVPPASEQPLLFFSAPVRKRNRKNNKKAKKKVRVDDQLPVVVVPLSQVPSCSVAQ